MLENIVDIMIEKVKKEVVTDENMQNVPLAYLMTREIPDSVKHFFDQEVELWIREEEEKFTSNERFDYDMPEVRMHIDNIFDVLKQSANFHITKFNQLLERAVKLEMNFLVEPQRTLTQFLFKDSQIVSTMEVYDTLKYFFRYTYYKDAISDYFNTKYLREISQDQFKDLMKQIDEKIYEENVHETTLKTLKTICGFINEAKEEESDVLSIEALEHVFNHIREGTQVAYTVCTFTPEESDELLQEILKDRDDIEIEKPLESLIEHQIEPGIIRFLPGRKHLEG